MQRLRPGDSLHLGVAPHAMPDAAPVAEIYDDTPSLVATVTLALQDAAERFFAAAVLLDASYAAGDYTVSYSWDVAAAPYAESDSFEVFAGGDGAGEVLAMGRVVTPNGQHVLMQTRDGSLTVGRNPSPVEV